MCQADTLQKIHTRSARRLTLGHYTIHRASAGEPVREEQLHKALKDMESALRLLDSVDAPADIGALLDLAICRVRELTSVVTSKAGDAGASPVKNS